MTVKERPKVFHLITRLLQGGAEEVVINIILGLDQYEFTLGYGESFEQAQVDRLRNQGIDTKRFPLIRHYNPITAIPGVFSLVRYLQRNNFDIVHTHSTEAGIIGRFAAALAGVPHVVHTVHGVPFTDDRNPVLNKFVLACERQAAVFSDRIVTNADRIAKEYQERGIGSPDQYKTVYIGVDREKFRGATPATDLPGTRPRIVMVGRLAEGKGFELMIDAVERVSIEEYTVCLVGEGPMYDLLMKLVANRGISDRVFLTGYRNDIPQVLAASDILVLPSFREGTPRVILEAMASGLPVVATDVAGIPEQVVDGESGFLIPTGDVDALANRIDELLANWELRNQMGARGYERSEQFSIEAMLEDIDKLYKELLN